MFIYGSVENMVVPYNGSEIMKRIKESKRAIFLDDLKNLKILEAGAANIRAFAKPVLNDEGYRIEGNEISKVKLFTEE